MASGDTLAILKPTTVSYGGGEYYGARRRHTNCHPTLGYISSTFPFGAYYYWCPIMPRHYSYGGVTVYIHYCTSAIVGDTDWGARFFGAERMYQTQAQIAARWARSQSVIYDVQMTWSEGNVVPGTAYLVDIVSIPCTDGYYTDYVRQGEPFKFEINRLGNDELTGEALFMFAELRET